MDQHSDHEDVRSEHSDQDHDNPPVEHDDGKSTFSSSHLTEIHVYLLLSILGIVVVIGCNRNVVPDAVFTSVTAFKECTVQKAKDPEI